MLMLRQKAKNKNMAKKIVVKFHDIEIGTAPAIPRPDQGRKFSKVTELQVGFGSRVFRMDRQGLWLGAEKFEDAPFSVDMEGNVVGVTFAGAVLTGVTINGSEINGGTITGSLFRTAEDGVRIEIDSPTDQNEIRFYEDTDLYATLLVRKVDDDGLIEIVDPDGAGFRLTSGVGASGFGSAELMSIGGTVATSGNATNGSAGLYSKDSFYFAIVYNAADNGGDPFLYTNAIPTVDPEVVGALWNDGGTVKISAG